MKRNLCRKYGRDLVVRLLRRTARAVSRPGCRVGERAVGWLANDATSEESGCGGRED